MAFGSRPALRLCRCVLHSVRAFAFLSQHFAAVQARRCVSVGMFSLGSRLTLRFYRGVLPRFTPAVCRIAPNRTACGILRFYSAGRDRHLCVLAVLARLSSLAGSLRVWAFVCGDLDGVAGETGDAGDGERGWRRGLCASLRGRIGLVMLSAGSTLGLRAPDCAKESSTLWTLFTRRRGWTGACSQPLCVFARAHWLCCAFRGEYAGAKCGSRTAAAPNLRQRVECGSGTAASLDSPHAAAGLCWCAFAPPSPGYTERPARL